MKEGDIIYINRSAGHKSYGIVLSIGRRLVKIRMLTFGENWTSAGFDGQVLYHYNYNCLHSDVHEL